VFDGNLFETVSTNCLCLLHITDSNFSQNYFLSHVLAYLQYYDFVRLYYEYRIFGLDSVKNNGLLLINIRVRVRN
jgi:hypothetical protein